MLEALAQLDARGLAWVQEHVRHAWLEGPMHVLSGLRYHVPWLVLVALLLWVRGGVKGRRAVVVALVLVAVTDQLSSAVLKELFLRPRPHGGTSYSFPSSHAANMFGQAVFFSGWYRRAAWALLPAALLVSLSRVYLAKHYPFDVLGGAVVGAGCGVAALVLAARYEARLDAWIERGRLALTRRRR